MDVRSAPRELLAGGDGPHSSLVLQWSSNLWQRAVLLTVLFVSELTLLSLWLDGASLAQRTGLLAIVGGWGAWVLKFILAFAAIFVTFWWLKNKAAIESLSSQVQQIPIRWGLFVAHCCAMATFVKLSSLIYIAGKTGREDLLGISWLVAGLSAIIVASIAIVPWVVWASLVRGAGQLLGFALIGAFSACFIGNMIRQVWQPVTIASHLTFAMTKWFLNLFVSGAIANPASMLLGTQRFSVEIAPQCSGLEGVGLVLAFGLLWLIVFRRECRFPQSLLLVPFGVALIFILNAARIATLILIGDAGAQQIALGGFHSQAGWIAFNVVAVGFCCTIQQVPWFTNRPQKSHTITKLSETSTGAFLLPFLAILAAGMLGKAFSASFEWLYPLRFFAAAGMLWVCRRSYTELNWRCDWVAPVIGTTVFIIWIGMDHFLHLNPGADLIVPATSTAAMVIWISFRVLAAVITVPLAEELAFRGYFMRRLISADFNLVSFRSFTWFSLLGSSVTFGVLHGGNWLVGCVAGILFGLAVVRRGRIGDAVVAHGTANALLVAYVLLTN